ncbi:hypothetical protein X777_10292 [Ooceraea biroi]|uniref:Uncharacterized protein n=1 Tax=Ooceraea biroi TaxID=2015173 RepID=A0A026W6C3_OOCBI|nr:hypothetical protein X777_10292 [Ooceraea biroi]
MSAFFYCPNAAEQSSVHVHGCSLVYVSPPHAVACCKRFETGIPAHYLWVYGTWVQGLWIHRLRIEFGFSEQNYPDNCAHSKCEKAKVSHGYQLVSREVFWSKLIYGPANDSFLVYHKTVLKDLKFYNAFMFSHSLLYVLFQDKTCYELQLKCQYFLQMQAMVVYGGRRLTSRKASKVFNSTDYMAYVGITNERSDLSLKPTSGDILAGATYPSRFSRASHELSLRGCQDTSGLVGKQRLQHVQCHLAREILTKKTSHYDLRQLRNDCTYSANMRNMRECGGNDDHGISIEFFATGCRDDQK